MSNAPPITAELRSIRLKARGVAVTFWIGGKPALFTMTTEQLNRCEPLKVALARSLTPLTPRTLSRSNHVLTPSA